MNHGICLYMTYLMVEAAVVVGVVALQIKFLFSMLGPDTIV